VKKNIVLFAILVLSIILSGCVIESQQEYDQRYEEAFQKGWEEAMNQVDESGALVYAEDAANFLDDRDYDEAESWIDATISALYGLRRIKPKDYMYR